MLASWVLAAAVASSDVPSVQELVVDGGPFATAALIEDLRLRLPSVAVEPTSLRPRSGDELAVYVVVRSAPAHALSLVLITSDGRAFDRELQVEPDWPTPQQRRLVARNVANLIEGIEAGTVAPDRTNVEPPAPCPACPACPKQQPQECPQQTPCSAPVRKPKPATPPPATWLVGVHAAAGIAAGLGEPADVDRFTGGGGALGFAVRAPVGWAVVANLRVLTLGNPSASARMIRWGVRVGGGYVFRPRPGFLELESTAGLLVEPWSLRRDGSRAPGPDRAPSLGGWARLGAGIRLRAGSVPARIGPWFGLSASGVPREGGLRVIRVEFEPTLLQQADPAAFRLGGFELEGGVEAVMWFGSRSQPAKRSDGT